MIKLILNVSLLKIIFSFIKIPFFTYYCTPPDNISEPSYTKYFSENNIYTHLLIGSPPQKIVSLINFNEYSFNIYNNRCQIPSDYNSENPISKTKKDLGFLLTDVYVDTFLTEDIFSFFEITKENKTLILSYIYAPMNNNEFEMTVPKFPYTCANIGLKLSSDQLEAFKYNFLRELKALNIIDNYVFYIEYNETNNKEGNLIIGKKPHEENNKYDYKQYKEIYALNMEIGLYWMLRFDTIFLKNVEKGKNLFIFNISKNSEAIIEHNLNNIFGTYEFMEFIENNFFEEKINNNICKKNYLLNNLINYECNFFKDIEYFPTIFFEHKNLMYIFELNYKDIFVKYNDKYICLIWFDLKNKNKWRLGKPFLKKYLFSFDLDKKIIGFYNPNIKDEIEEKNNNKNIKLTLLIIIILSLISFFICYLFAKTIYKNKKIIFNDKITTELMSMEKE